MVAQSGTTRIDQLGLNGSDFRRINSWMAEIAADLSPNCTPVRHSGGETRLGRKGSLCVYEDGSWYSYEADEGGRGPQSLIKYFRPDIEPAELKQFIIDWLATHPGMGSGSGDHAHGDEVQRSRAERTAMVVAQVLRDIGPTQGTLAQQYLEGRSIYGDNWPTSLVGYVADDERPGEGAIVGVIVDANGASVGIQIGYLDALGRKVEVAGTARRQFLLEHAAPGLGFHVKPAALDPALPLYTCEGLENTLSLALAYPRAEIIGLPGIGRMRRLPSFRGRNVVVFRDGDAPDSPASRTLTTGVDHLLIGGALVKVTATSPGADANSVLQDGGVEPVRALVDSALPAKLSPEGIVKQCASLNEMCYQLARRKHAKSIGIKLSVLDQQVARERARRRGNDKAAPAEDEDIHPERVNDIAGILDVARAEVEQYVVADPMQLDMAVVWALHSHFTHHLAIDLAISPRLLITAPSPECGKTTLLEAVGELTARPLELSSISSAAFFRLNDAQRPTLLIDELQGLLGRRGGNAELEGILTASHRRRSAKTVRVEENEHKKLEPRTFDSWGTYAATCAGRLSYALESRCLKVTLRRALPGEVKKHLQDGTSETLVTCRRKFARWAQDQSGLPDVLLPPVLANRRGDNWRPLFRIAALAGGRWPQRIEAAALAAIGQPMSTDVIVALLTDIREILGARDRILTTELIEALRSLEDPSWDWTTCYRGGPVNAYWLRDRLANVLDPPGAKVFKVGRKTRHGYEARQFHDANKRYIQPHNSNEHDGAEPKRYTGSDGDSVQSSETSETGTNNPQKSQGNYLVSDGEDTKRNLSETHVDPKPETASEGAEGCDGFGSTVVSDAGTDPQRASETAKNPGNSAGKSIRLPDGSDQKRKNHFFALYVATTGRGATLTKRRGGGEELDGKPNHRFCCLKPCLLRNS